MKKSYLLLFLLRRIIWYTQTENRQVKLDSIIKEADLLYNYEKAAWVATDLLMPMEKLRNNYGGYIVYHSNDTIYATIMDQTQRKRLARSEERRVGKKCICRRETSKEKKKMNV